MTGEFGWTILCLRFLESQVSAQAVKSWIDVRQNYSRGMRPTTIFQHLISLVILAKRQIKSGKHDRTTILLSGAFQDST